MEMEMDIDREEINAVYIDDFYESIDAPMFVDFTLPLPEPDDGPEWFCHRIGCTENHDQKIFELPVAPTRTSKFAELLAARRKLTSTEKPETLRIPFALPGKLSRTKLASICNTSKSIQTKASAASVIPKSMGLKEKGKEMMNIKVCGHNAKVGDSLKEKKGEMKAPVFHGANGKNVKVSQPLNAKKSIYVAQKSSSISLMKSKSMKSTIVCEDRGNKKDGRGIKMIGKKEKENLNGKIYGLTRIVEGKATSSSTNLSMKGEKSRLGVDAPKDSKNSSLKVRVNANKLNVKMGVMEMDIDKKEINAVYMDDFSESIDAPMYVNFTFPLPEPDDGPAWFCHSICCTKNHEQKIFELPVVQPRTSKFAELLAARRKLTSTEKPTEIHKIPFAPPLKLSKPKFSICNASKNIQTKASAARVVPPSLGLKAKGKEMMNIKVCAAQKSSSINLMESKSMKSSIVCGDRGNKKDDRGIKMIVNKKKEYLNGKIYGLRRVVEGKAISSSTNVSMKGEKSRLGVDAPKDSKNSLLKVRMNANKLNVEGEKSKVGVDASEDTKIPLIKVAMDANKINGKEEKLLKMGINGNKPHVKVEKSKLGVDALKDNDMSFLKRGKNATKRVIEAKKEINGKVDKEKFAENVCLKKDGLKLGGKSSSEKKRGDGSKVATNERLALLRRKEGKPAPRKRQQPWIPSH